MSRAALAFVALGIVASAAVLESAFEGADHRKAVDLVRDHRLRELRLEDYLRSRHADSAGQAVWSSTVTSGCRGFVRVVCEIPRRAALPARYVFDVDLPRRSLHPADGQGALVLREFERASASAAAPKR
ncbi:MAG: hypothetical protein AABZ30_00480 [Myxococcota bacterium]